MPAKKTTAKRKQTDAVVEKKPFVIPSENPRSRLLMWVGVGTVSAMILLIWGWSFSISIEGVSLKTSEEGQLIAKSQTNWNDLFPEEEKQRQELIKSTIMGAITEIINTVSSTASTTEMNSENNQISTTTNLQLTINTSSPSSTP